MNSPRGSGNRSLQPIRFARRCTPDRHRQERRLVSGYGTSVDASHISSGESEVVALGTEIFDFFDHCRPDTLNVLLLDEPDVHLHPDLQARLARFLIQELENLPANIKERTMVCVSTHSTPLICELSLYQNCSIGTKHFDSETITQSPVAVALKKLAPFFGHSLSRAITNDVPLIIEGEDDERVWQQAARTSQGRLRIFPSLAITVDQQTELEKSCDGFLRSIYDEPIAISIRDGDGKIGKLDSIGCVKRFRLQCYAAENLLLTDDVLASLGSNWSDFVAKAKEWCTAHPQHKDVKAVEALTESNDRFRHKKIKDIRNLIPGILGTTKPWEACVGQELGRISAAASQGPNGLVEYVGTDILRAVGLLPYQS